MYIAPLNLVEIVVSALTEWWLPKHTYETVNDWIMAFLYSPLLVVAAYLETKTAHKIRQNRARGEEDDDVVQEWEQLADEMDFEAEGWIKTCDSVRPNVEDDAAALEVKKLRSEVAELKTMITKLAKERRE